jgi:hypothetical protein
VPLLLRLQLLWSLSLLHCKQEPVSLQCLNPGPIPAPNISKPTLQLLALCGGLLHAGLTESLSPPLYPGCTLSM